MTTFRPCSRHRRKVVLPDGKRATEVRTVSYVTGEPTVSFRYPGIKIDKYSVSFDGQIQGMKGLIV